MKVKEESEKVGLKLNSQSHLKSSFTYTDIQAYSYRSTNHWWCTYIAVIQIHRRLDTYLKAWWDSYLCIFWFRPINVWIQTYTSRGFYCNSCQNKTLGPFWPAYWKCELNISKKSKRQNFIYSMEMIVDFPGSSDGKSVCLQPGRPGFDPWVGKIPWRRKWQPTPVLLPGKSHGRGLVGYSPWGRKESDTTERLRW